MPGTVDPALAEAAHQVAFGDRHAVTTTTMAAEDGQHHLNAFDADRPALHVGVDTRGGSRQALLRDAR